MAETTLKKNQTADIPTKSGGKYSYQYVDIAQIHQYLEENNMRYIQKIERIEGDDYIFTKRFISGNWEDEWLQGCRVVQATLYGTTNPAQEQGSALTYARRYSLLLAFGLATEDDDGKKLDKHNESKATQKQIEVLKKNYTGDNLTKLLQANGIKKIEDITMNKASELINKLFMKGN